MDRSSDIILKKLGQEEVKWCCAQVKEFFSRGRSGIQTAGTGSSTGRSQVAGMVFYDFLNGIRMEKREIRVFLILFH